MRKINFLFGVLAVAATGLLSSCDWSDDDAVLNPNVTVPSLGENTLVVNTNVSATVKVGTQSKTGTATTFAVSGTTAKAEVSAAGYTTQNVEVTFGENSVLSVDVQLVKAVADKDKVDQAVAKGTSVQNGNDNKTATGVTATIEVPASTTLTGSEEGFSVVAYTPAEAGEQNLNQDANVELPVLALECTPSGASFTEPVTLTATTTDAAGCEVVCVNGTESKTATVSADGKSVSAQVDHFSVWSFVLKATVTKVVQEQDETIKSGSILLANGKNTISYTQKYGFEATGVQNGGLIANFLVNQFGKAGSVSKSVDVTSDKTGSANYTVKQAVKTYTFESGKGSTKRTFTAKVYGAVTVTIDSTTPDTSGHSGGSGR
ncbi:MAG: hypothetical protein NC206_01560 [Bacteroides sp.]|nr:hypothetical protein [Roseburia sp.]MCM1345757.1 hypothetical protein [Bacteroides sp.]MCM1420148.1 hypothetical protein [Bacteroides sp.]